MNDDLSNGRSIRAVLSRLFPMESLSEGSRLRLEASSRLVKAKAGEVLIRQGERADGAFYLIQGRVKVSLASSQGAEKVVDIVRERSCFGESLIFSDEPSPITAAVTKEAHLLHLRRDGIVHCIEHDPAFALTLLRAMGGCVHQMMRGIEACSLRSSLQRVAGFLLDEAEREAAGEEGCSIQLPASKSTIASHLNITPETLSRSLGELKGVGLIDVRRGMIQIHATADLRSYAAL